MIYGCDERNTHPTHSLSSQWGGVVARQSLPPPHQTSLVLALKRCFANNVSDTSCFDDIKMRVNGQILSRTPVLAHGLLTLV